METGEPKMAKKIKRETKRTVKRKLSGERQTRCKDLVKAENELKQYLDNKIKDIIIPRIESVDMRDKTQYDAAKKIIIDANSLMVGRMDVTEKVVKQVENEVKEIDAHIKEAKQERQEITQRLTQSFESLQGHFDLVHEKLDKHISDETQEFASIRDGLERAATHVEAIQQTLDNVSANGNKGLSNSMRDIHDKLSELEKVTRGARARAKFWRVISDVIDSTALLRPLKTKIGAVIYLSLIVLVVNTILHSLGFNFDIISLFKWLFSFTKGGQ